MNQIFQTRILQSYIDKQDEELLTLRWQKFQDFKDKIFSIKTMKEEIYQDGFLTDIFENCLGYTKNTTNPQNFNLEREKKNESDSKKVDGAISVEGNEDTTLLPLNTIYKIIDLHKNQEFTNFSLYKMYGIYFEAINAGNEKLGINKYNGGLFAGDEALNNLVIDDSVLQEKAKVLSAYNFGSDISVNILGHIFEQSISDIEELTASIENTDFDKTKSKRKKDGVFYTPAYITSYIVDNTLGKMCHDKREELNVLSVEPLASGKKPTKKQQKQKDNLMLYKEWILNLKILDPACGSGAFLNQALEFLLDEHKKLQYDFALTGDIFASYQIDKVILENNLYGVDINESAVEIAKLSLWLKTADNKRPLTKLADKILCANSLLDMPFEEGSFDIIIGNPPYVRVQGLKSNYEDEALLYEKKFMSATGKYDLYVLFMEMSFKMLKRNGKLSYILPHKFLIADFGSGIREFFVQNKAVESLLHFGSEMVFKDASAYTCIINLSHDNDVLKFKHIKPTQINKSFEYDKISYKNLGSDKWDLTSQDELKVIQKLQELKQNFINDLELEKVSKKLQNFEKLSFDDFAKELKKAKKLKFKDKLEERNFKNEWKTLFEQDAKIAQDLHANIDKVDKEIDAMVYELYGLDEKEIAIVEESCK